MDQQAQTLNDIIQSQNSNILEMLSKRGKNIFFPITQFLLQSVYSHESYHACIDLDEK